MNHLHLLSDGQILVEEQIYVHVVIASLDAPGHSADDFVEDGQTLDMRPVVPGPHQDVDDFLLLALLFLIFATFHLIMR